MHDRFNNLCCNKIEEFLHALCENVRGKNKKYPLKDAQGVLK